MNKPLIFVGGLLAGTITGFFIGKIFYKKKYEYLANEEIESVREAYQNDVSADDTPFDISPSKNENLSNIKSYGEIINEYSSKKEMPPVEEAMTKSYIISPDRFGEECDSHGNEYALITLLCYKDGIITYEDSNDICTNAYEILGCDPMDHFGEYEEYTVYIRNDELCIDYEILFEPNYYNPEPYED